MASADGSLLIRTKVDTSGIKKGVGVTKTELNSLKVTLGSLAKSMALVFGVTYLVKFAKDSIQASNEIENAFVGLQSITEGQGRSFEKAKEFIKDYISDGLIPAKDAITAYKNLAMRGYDDTQLQNVLLRLKDSASFGRQASLTLGNAVRSATEGLKNENSILVDNAGVTKNVSKMWEDYARNIGVGAKSLTQQQKIQAEVNGIMQETRFQIGDAEKVADIFSGKILSMQFAFFDLKVAVGNFIKPIANAFLPLITTSINMLTRFFNAISKVTQAIFGYKLSANDTKQAVQDTATAQEDVANSTEKTAKASEKAVASFDKINKLSSSTAKATGGKATAGGTGIIKDITPDVKSEKIKDFAFEIPPILEPAIKAFGRLRENLEPLGETIGAGLSFFYENVLVPFGEWVLTSLVPIFIDILGSSIRLLNEILLIIQPTLEWLVTNILMPLANFVWDLIIASLEAINGTLKVLADWASKHRETLQTVFSLITSFFGGIVFYYAVQGVAGMVLGISTALAKFTVVLKGLSTWLLTCTAKNILFFGSLGLLVGAIILVSQNWSKMNGLQRVASVLGIVAIAAATAAIAFGSLQSAWTLGIAAAGIVGGITAIAVAVKRANKDAKKAMKDTDMTGVDSSVFKIPKLAKGAVIPPNKEFMAILGDQKRGTNIEAPLDTIVNAFNIANAKNSVKGNGMVHVHLHMDGKEITDTVVDTLNGETEQNGVSRLLV